MFPGLSFRNQAMVLPRRLPLLLFMLDAVSPLSLHTNHIPGCINRIRQTCSSYGSGIMAQRRFWCEGRRRRKERQTRMGSTRSRGPRLSSTRMERGYLLFQRRQCYSFYSSRVENILDSPASIEIRCIREQSFSNSVNTGGLVGRCVQPRRNLSAVCRGFGR